MRNLYPIAKCAILGACLFLSSCMVGPNYHRPKNCVPPEWHNAPPDFQETDPISLTYWWKEFHDPILDSLICRTLACNYDLRNATIKIREARALYRIEEANLWPNLSFQALYAHQRFSKNALGTTGPLSANGGGLGLGSFLVRTQDLFQATFDATWEIDIFGGIQRGVEAQYALYGAAIENRRDVLVSLLSEVALNYMDLRGYQQQILVAEKNICIQKETLSITEQRLNAGLDTDLDVERVKALLATTQAAIPPLRTLVKQAIHRLSILTGKEPGALYCELCPVQDLPCNPPVVPTGIPAQLICRRPDIREAERQLASVSANIGVAIAQLYPQISLSGDIGYQSNSLGNFISPGSSMYTFGPTLNLPIFNAGALEAGVKVNKARFQEALMTYRQTILKALEEVENAMVAYGQEHAHYCYLQQAYEANKKSVALAQEQFTKGLVDFLNVLSAEENLYTSENNLLISRVALSTDLVAIYKALGGGWEWEEPYYIRKTSPPLPPIP